MSSTSTSDDENGDQNYDGPIHINGEHYIHPSTNLHRVPATAVHPSSIIHAKKRRAIFRTWPRDPNGKVILPNGIRGGKVAPNGIPSWGATLYDFYSVEPVPDNPCAMTYISGSRIAAAVRAIGELEHAKDELEWADEEEDPHEIPVADTGELIECYEAQKWNYGISSVLMFDRPLSSLFYHSHYPPPWPFIPFANPYPPVLLQQRIPMHLLPKTLYVHDPYSLLHVNEYRDTSNDETPWINMRPKVYRYRISFWSSTLKAVKESQKAAEESERKKKRVLQVFRFIPTEEECARGEPAYDVPLPTRPSAPTRVEEAHLYLSPAGKLGQGNHSMVYKAEWELPRELFAEPRLCHTCIYEELRMQVSKLKRSGRWRKMMYEAGGKEFDSERITVLQPQSNSGQEHMTPSSTCDSQDVTIFRVYCPNIRWQTPADPSTRCTHFLFRTDYPVPRTSVFQVAAKLSIQHDPHLKREAGNYQEFPEHFFKHWNGYNLIRPIHNPVPLHALVPQFYGYYVPVDEVALSMPEPLSGENGVKINKASGETANEKGRPPPYLSPILLLEHCGKPVDPSTLSEDDREECASLCLRFNHAGWLHESIAERNVLVQRGLPTQWPIERHLPEFGDGPENSFRLIDFGRSRKIYDASESQLLRLGMGETAEALILGKVLYGEVM
ncbi:hypothetical protein EDC04DRAFT_2582786 [Pisolithus marmoratus]|nr:hypothetical protein EDC04DRAFT_2582786 [Pisolithus marmoratus]